MELTRIQQDRAAGVMVGVAVGDALGIPYEFSKPQGLTTGALIPGMPGGGPFGYDAGEFSDDTQMSLCVARAALRHDLTARAGMDAVASNFAHWYRSGPKDVGGQVSSVLRGFRAEEEGLSRRMGVRAREVHKAHPNNSAGNGSLMRTAPVALRYLGADPERLAGAAARVSALTHADPSCLDACAMWSRGIRAGVLYGCPSDGLRAGVSLTSSRMLWDTRMTDAERELPQVFRNNGWVVHAFQAAWSAVKIGIRDDSFATGITAAVNCGLDTDTVASIAGGMLGSYFGLSGIPEVWQRGIRGGDGTSGARLAEIGVELAARA